MTSSVDSATDVVAAAGRLAPVLAALSDPNRLAILLAITQQPRSVKGLTDAVRLPQTLVSHHLKTLRDTGLVTVAAHGRSNIYTLCCAPLAEPARLLATLAAGDPLAACPPGRSATQSESDSTSG
ncbi:DNA-binding transcriptional ArsR family regulator [Actinoplanes octamycinicus]|uniref:DNA-binding transcriptional ArsR family regulator n=1 Tax=Actinoplanes octamycinicus TaxID=135948 RepID=A0A7W7H2P0_9ACTN|nr:metalloregulator ArsR/SmtB family transcription factor [Actinoplanes octamycinicus]MBB4742797.1 DNA-binding transcriptional ArsR family regulator [Actinoplanes octamycinicus]GIE58348.1 hypothetical protein Aoc01nite_37500 [Actinoplanes octamycinicus]